MKSRSAFIIAGTSSGVGKTTVTLGLLRAFRNLGFEVQPFKAGPDFIDPIFHQLASGKVSYNLDTWMMGEKQVVNTYQTQENWQIAIIEGVMGLFDGKDDPKNSGSAAALAKLLRLPVILVVDAGKVAGSVAATILGFEQFDPKLNLAGIIFNNVNSLGHFALLKKAVKARCRAEVLGYIPDLPNEKISSRHLGLSLPGSNGSDDINKKIENIAQQIQLTVSLKKLIALGKIKNTGNFVRKMKPYLNFKAHPAANKVKIAVAWDQAFCFYYQENFDLLRKHGAELVFFSPLIDKKVPVGTSGLYLGGGYPELFTTALSQNAELRKQVKDLGRGGLPIYAECGGLMYLGQAIEDRKIQRSFPMVGLFPWTTYFPAERMTLGYRTVKANKNCLFMNNGGVMRGHEFHYSKMISEIDNNSLAYRVIGKSKKSFAEGYRVQNALASYIHLHFSSNPQFSKKFVSLCRNYG